MRNTKPTNPFYVALLPVGVLFALTACAFVVMMMQAGGPQRVAEDGLIRVMERHGIAIMTLELGLLAIFTIAAIATDDFWVRRFEATGAREIETEDVQ
jgi:formate-dependent nitrite reductase membrane component NrfD